MTRSRIQIMLSEDFRIKKYMTFTKSRLNEEVSGHQKRIPVYNPIQGKFVLRQSSEALKSGLRISGSKRN